MKKLILGTLAIGILGFTSCGGNDNANPSNDCQTCILSIFEETITSEFCDNGDGTITITTNGEEETESLEGLSFNEFIAAFEGFGATCN